MININVINGEGNVNIYGDLHTDKSIAMAHGTELEVPDGNNFGSSEISGQPLLKK